MRAVCIEDMVRTKSSPGAGRPGFVGVGQQGPTQK